MAKKIEIKQVHSPIGKPKRQRRTLEALGLHKMHQSVTHEDSPSLRGMLHMVSDLVEIRDAE